MLRTDAQCLIDCLNSGAAQRYPQNGVQQSQILERLDVPHCCRQSSTNLICLPAQ
jgi:hypothetical protein